MKGLYIQFGNGTANSETLFLWLAQWRCAIQGVTTVAHCDRKHTEMKNDKEGPYIVHLVPSTILKHSLLSYFYLCCFFF